MQMQFCTVMSAGLATKVGHVQFHAMRLTDLFADTIPQTTVSESKPSAFPSSLRAKQSEVQTLSADDRKTEAVIEKTCPDCARKEMFYTTVQLRSADEGSTVFYRCVCGFKYAVPPRLTSSVPALTVNRETSNN